MNLYQFETDQFSLSSTGIHLLRSRFNYATIEYASIDQLVIEKGRQVRNWFLLLLFGLLLFSFGMFTGFKVIYEYFFVNNFQHFYIEQFVLPVLPLFVGVFSIYYSLKTGPVLKIILGNKTKQFPVEQLKQSLQMEALKQFLANNPQTKNKFRPIDNIQSS